MRTVHAYSPYRLCRYNTRNSSSIDIDSSGGDERRHFQRRNQCLLWPNSRHPLSVRCSAEAVKRNDSDSYQLKIASLFRGYLNFDLVNTALRVVECQLMCRYLTLYLSLDADGVERHIRWHCLRRVINGLYLETTQCRLEIDTYGGTVHGKRQIS